MNYEKEIQELIKKLPKKLRIRYTLNCALDVKHLMTDVSLKALKVVELWLQDKVTTQEVNIAAGNAMNCSKNDADDIAVYAAYSVDYHSDGMSAILTTPIKLGVDIKIYYEKLIKFINDNISETEKIIYNIKI